MCAARGVRLVAVLLGSAGLTLLDACSSDDVRSVTCEGDVSITTTEEWAAFVARGCSSVTGDLRIWDSDLEVVGLPELATAHSVAIFGNPELKSVSLPSLTTVGTLWVAGNVALTGLSLPALTRVDGELYVTNNSAYPSCEALTLLARLRAAGYAGRALVSGNDTSASCPSVGICPGDVVIGSRLDWTALTDAHCEEIAGDLTIRAPDLVELPGQPAITRVDGRLGVTENTSLAILNLPALTSVHTLWIWRNDALSAVALPSLTAAPGVAECGMSRWPPCPSGLEVSDNPELTSLSLPALTTVSALGISANVSLASLSMPSLSTVDGELHVTGNTALPSCDALALVARLRDGGYAGRALVSGNDTSAACPTSPVCPGAVVIESSEDWTALVETGCNEVAGDLTIRTSDVTLLAANPSIALVDGHLGILDNEILARLIIPAVAKTYGLTVSGNAALVGLDLPRLATIEGDLTITGNPTLATLGLDALATAGQYNVISGNAALEDIVLPALTGAGGLSIRDNARLVTVSLPALPEVAIALDFSANPSLTSLSAPSLVTGGWAGIGIADDPALTSVSLPVLATGGVSVSNTALTSLELPALTSGGVSVSDTALTNLGLPALTTGDVSVSNTALTGLELAALVSGELAVDQNPSLISLNLPALTTCPDDGVSVTNNPALTTIGLPVLSSADNLQVYGNEVLETLNAPALATLTEDCGGVFIGETMLTSLSLPALRSTCMLSLWDNPAMVSLDVPALSSVNAVHVVRNGALAGLALEHLTSLAVLQIEGNTALRNLDLGALTSVQYYVHVRNNPALPQCQATAILARLVAFGGESIISGNDTTQLARRVEGSTRRPSSGSCGASAVHSHSRASPSPPGTCGPRRARTA